MKKKMLAGLTIGAITLTALLGEVALGGNQVLTRAEAATSTKEVWFTTSENVIDKVNIPCTTTTLHGGTLNPGSAATYMLSSAGGLVSGAATQTYNNGRYKDYMIIFVSDTDLSRDAVNFYFYANGISAFYCPYTCLNCHYYPDVCTYTLYSDVDCKNVIETAELPWWKTKTFAQPGRAIKLRWAYTDATHVASETQNLGVKELHFTWAC